MLAQRRLDLNQFQARPSDPHLMIETPEMLDYVRPVRLERLMRERGLSETEAMDIMTAQMPAELKRARADYVIDNSGDRAATEARTREFFEALLAELRGRR